MIAVNFEWCYFSHSLDSSETAAKEIKYFFPEFNLDHWFEEEMKTFQDGQVWFDDVEEIHKVKTESKFSVHNESR